MVDLNLILPILHFDRGHQSWICHILCVKYVCMKNRRKYFNSYNLIFFIFFSIRDQSVLVIEDLSEKGFRSKDWFKYKLNHQEVLLSLTELAKFHACGLAYRLIILRESFCLPFYQKHWHFFLHFGTFSRRYCKYRIG